MKEVYRDDDIVAYDGFKDAFGGKMIVVVNETDEKFAPADKKWMQDRTVVMIPLIYDYKERC